MSTAELPDSQLGVNGVAARLGVQPSTIHRYRHADRAKYRFPTEDGVLSGRPWWWASTIDRWSRERLGQPGVGKPQPGQGRPRKAAGA